MELPEAISKVDNLVLYGLLAEMNINKLRTTSPVIIESSESIRNQDKRVKNALNFLWAKHDDLYSVVDRLHTWANTDKPLLKHYESGVQKDVKQLSLYRLGKNYGLGVIIASTLTSSLTGYAFDSTIRYNSDLNYYQGLEKDFSKQNIALLTNFLDYYNFGLQIFINEAEPCNMHNNITDLIDNYIETQNFRRDAEEIVQVIRESKKNPQAIKSVLSETTPTESDISLQHAKNLIQNKQVYSNKVLVK